MNLSIPVPVFIVFVMCVATTYYSFKTFAVGQDTYGIGALFAGLFSLVGCLFLVACLFAGAYFGWWL